MGFEREREEEEDETETESQDGGKKKSRNGLIKRTQGSTTTMNNYDQLLKKCLPLSNRALVLLSLQEPVEHGEKRDIPNIIQLRTNFHEVDFKSALLKVH